MEGRNIFFSLFTTACSFFQILSEASNTIILDGEKRKGIEAITQGGNGA